MYELYSHRVIYQFLVEVSKSTTSKLFYISRYGWQNRSQKHIKRSKKNYECNMKKSRIYMITSKNFINFMML